MRNIRWNEVLFVSVLMWLIQRGFGLEFWTFKYFAVSITLYAFWFRKELP